MSAVVLFITGCNSIDMEQLTTQPREYVEDFEQVEEKEVFPESDNIDDDNSVQYGWDVDDIKNVYSDVDFNQKVLSVKDEELVSHLILKERFVEDSELSYNEGGRYEETPFYVKINSAKVTSGKAGLDDYFFNCDELNNADSIDFYGKDIIDNSQYLTLNITMRNESQDSYVANMGSKEIEVNYGEIGIYRLSETIGTYIDHDYVGNNRGVDKAYNEITFASGEEITMNVVFMLQDAVDLNALYYNVNNIFRSGEIYDDGDWHADAEGAPNIIKINICKE